MDFRRIILFTSLLFTASSTVIVPRANAGLAFGLASGKVVQYSLYGAAVGFGVTQITLLIDDAYADRDWEVIRNDTLIGTALGLIMDVEISGEDPDLVSTYAKVFPWVDNYEALEELAKLTQKKLEVQLKKNPNRGAAYISFNETEIESVFSGMALTKIEREELYRILK